MDGRAFLAVARWLVTENDEAWLRTSAGRAYYALFLEARDALSRWGFGPIPEFQVHSSVRQFFERKGMSDLNLIAIRLRELQLLRNGADYHNDELRSFASPYAIEQAIDGAAEAIDVLLQIDSEAGRRDAAIAAIRQFP
jgi:hypothetical protein